MALTEGLAALSSLKSIYEIAKDVRNATDPEKLRSAAAQMFDLALAAREQTAALQEERNSAMTELAALKAEIEAAKTFDAKAEGYILKKMGMGGFAYVIKDSAQPQHELPAYCPYCFENKKFAIFQPTGVHRHFRCPSCKGETKL